MASTRPPLSMVRHVLLPEAIATLLVAFPPSPIWRFSGVIVVCYLRFTALLTTTGTEDGFRNYSLGCAFAVESMIMIGFVWLVNPIHDYRREKDPVLPHEQTWWQRVHWAFSLRRNPRGIGWNYQVSNVPLPPTYPRWSFVRRYILRSLLLFLLRDAAETYLSYFPLFSQADAHSPPIPLWGQLLDGIALIALGTRVFATGSMHHAILAVISVAIGLSEPRHWPKLFGHWSDAYTVRRFWGRTWHQILRQILTIYGKSFAQFLGFQPGSSGSSYTQLYIAFIVSGIIHCGGDLMVGKQYVGLSFPFFFAQAVAITLEDGILALLKMSGILVPDTLARLVGYSWVAFWFNLSLPWYMHWFVDAGTQQTTLPFSPIRAVIRSLEMQARPGFIPG